MLVYACLKKGVDKMYRYFSNYKYKSSYPSNILRYIEAVLHYSFVKRDMLKYVYQNDSVFSKKLITIGQAAYESTMKKWYPNHFTSIDDLPRSFFVQCILSFGIQQIYKQPKVHLTDEKIYEIFLKLIGAVALDCRWEPLIIEQTVALFNYYEMNDYFEKNGINFISKVHLFGLNFNKHKFFEKLIINCIQDNEEAQLRFFACLEIQDILYDSYKAFYRVNESGRIRLEIYHMLYEELVTNGLINDDMLLSSDESIYLEYDFFDRWDGLLENELFCE